MIIPWWEWTQLPLVGKGIKCRCKCTCFLTKINGDHGGAFENMKLDNTIIVLCIVPN